MKPAQKEVKMAIELATEVRQIPVASADGYVGRVRLNRRSEIVNQAFIRQAAMEGRVYCASAGALSTPITWTATATADYTKSALFGAVPSGVTVIPLSIDLYMEAFGTTAQFECVAAVGTGGIPAGGSAVTPTNMRTDAPNVSTTVWTSDLTGGTACTTNVSEFWRDGQQFAITKTAGSATAAASDPIKFSWKLADSDAFPVIVGPGQLEIAQGSQAGTGFCTVIYIEYPTTSIT
jgi:hypothetical protein